MLGAQPDEIVFTSGGTEATNHAIKGAAYAALERGEAGSQVVISAVEHPATQETARFVERLGFKRVVVGVDRYGVVDLDAMERALRAPTLIVSVMHANNETGSLQPIAEIARLAHARGALMHIDAAQSAGKIRVDVGELGADLVTLAGHKMYAPKGIGALFVRRGVRLESLIHGAGHETGRRAGTENVPYIVALGEATRIAHADLAETGARLTRLRDRLWAHLREGLGAKVVLNGHPERRLPNTLNASFVGSRRKRAARGDPGARGVHRLGLPRGGGVDLARARGDGARPARRARRRAPERGPLHHRGGGGPGRRVARRSRPGGAAPPRTPKLTRPAGDRHGSSLPPSDVTCNRTRGPGCIANAD